MKKISAILFIALSSILYSQELKYEEVVTVNSKTGKDELYNRAKLWASQNYNSKSDLIVSEDKVNGEISGIGVIHYRTDKRYRGHSCVEGPVKYNFSIYVKDGRYKYVFSSFDHKGSNGNLCRAGNFGKIMMNDEAPSIGKGIEYTKAWKDLKEKISTKVEGLSSELEKTMNRKGESSNDW